MLAPCQLVTIPSVGPVCTRGSPHKLVFIWKCPAMMFMLLQPNKLQSSRKNTWSYSARWESLRAQRGAVWHSGTNDSLCCFTSSLDSGSWRVRWEIPVTCLTLSQTFNFLTEAAIKKLNLNSIYSQAKFSKVFLSALELNLTPLPCRLDQEQQGAKPVSVGSELQQLLNGTMASAAAPSSTRAFQP